MSSLYDFSRYISQLTREKKYNDALKFFKENKSNFSNEQIGNNEYLISDILSCLRHVDYFDAGFRFLSIYGIEINNEAKERILTAYGWLLWSKYKSENNNNNDHFENENNYFEEDETDEPLVNFHYNKTELIIKIEELIPLLYEKNSDFSRNLISILII